MATVSSTKLGFFWEGFTNPVSFLPRLYRASYATDNYKTQDMFPFYEVVIRTVSGNIYYVIYFFNLIIIIIILLQVYIHIIFYHL